MPPSGSSLLRSKDFTPVLPQPGENWYPFTQRTDISIPLLVTDYHDRTFAIQNQLPGTTIPFDALLDSIIEAQQNSDPPLPAINVDRQQGAILSIFAKQAVMGGKALAQAKGETWDGGKVVEVGTLGAFSTIHLGKGLLRRAGEKEPEVLGNVISIDISAHHVKLSRENIAKARMSGHVKVWHMPGQQGVERLLESDKENDDDVSGTGKGWKGKVDLIFIDADKTGSLDYFLTSLELVRPGGLIIIDNTIWQGSILPEFKESEEWWAEAAGGIRKMNEEIKKKLESGEVEAASAMQIMGERSFDGFTVLEKSW